MSTIDDVLAVAAAHGLHLTSEGASLNEAGLDYRVVLADDAAGQRWVLRQPRRPDVSDGMAAETRILDLVGPALASGDVAVPDWRVREPDLIAYPALPGAPGLTLTPAGEPVWHVDPASPTYAVQLGRLLARLHAIAPDQAGAAGVEVRTPAQVRQAWTDDVARVCAAFDVAPALLADWDAWLADDAGWPDRTVMTHGEIYPAHVLLDTEGAITGVLDWTTARVDDPARDLAAQYGAAGEEMLAVTLDAYQEAGGVVDPGMAARARRLWSSFPVAYALYALTTGAESDRTAATALLNP